MSWRLSEIDLLIPELPSDNTGSYTRSPKPPDPFGHYKRLNPEPIEVINGWDLNFNIGNVVKYIARYPFKGDPIGDLEKAQQYLDYEIQRQKKLSGR